MKPQTLNTLRVHIKIGKNMTAVPRGEGPWRVSRWITRGLVRVILKELTTLQPLLLFSGAMDQLLKNKRPLGDCVMKLDNRLFSHSFLTLDWHQISAVLCSSGAEDRCRHSRRVSALGSRLWFFPSPFGLAWFSSSTPAVWSSAISPAFSILFEHAVQDWIHAGKRWAFSFLHKHSGKTFIVCAVVGN